MKVTSHSFTLVAYLPIPKFLGVTSEVQSLLTAHVCHASLNIITQDLKTVERRGAVLSDPNSRWHIMHTPLVSYIADLPEMQMIAAVSSGHSPLSVATAKQVGDAKPHDIRTRAYTLNRIQIVVEMADPWGNLTEFCKLSKRHRLNGVYRPFWEDWGSADPSLFLTPDALHQWHKFFFDHILKWAMNLISPTEFDRRLSLLQPMVGE